MLSRLRRLSLDAGVLRRSRDFRALWLGQLVSLVGRMITVVAVPYQVYRLTGSPLAVGFLGVVQLVPLLAVSLAGGAVADRVDRRRLLILLQVLLGGCSGLLALGALLGHPPLAFVYGVTAASAAFSAVDGPTRQSMIPRLVRDEDLTPALALNVAMFQSSLVAGPAIAGLVLARFGLSTAYLIDAVTFGAAITALLLMAPQAAPAGRSEPTLIAVRRGLDFIRHQPAVLGGFVIDIIAMAFGMRRALYPVLAARTYHAGAGGLGLLFAAPAVGAVAAALTSGWMRRAQRLGVIVVISVAAWGVSVVGLGVAGSLVVAMATLAAGGAADAVSALARSTMLQTIAPDELRGRLNSVYFMVVVGGPYLGDIEAGATASLTSPKAAILSGGLLVLVGTAVVALCLPGLVGHRRQVAIDGATAPGAG